MIFRVFSSLDDSVILSMQRRGFEFQQAAFNTTEWHKGSCQEVKHWWQAEGPVPQSMPNSATGCRLVDLSLSEKEAEALVYEQDLCTPRIHKHIQKMQTVPDCWIQNTLSPNTELVVSQTLQMKLQTLSGMCLPYLCHPAKGNDNSLWRY